MATEILKDRVRLPECPLWHDGHTRFSDIHGNERSPIERRVIDQSGWA